jgi:hypothetical protein
MGASPPALVADLVERFERARKVFLSPDCKEGRLPKAKTPHEQESLKRTITASDNQIDELVCELQGLAKDKDHSCGRDAWMVTNCDEFRVGIDEIPKTTCRLEG